MLRRRTYLWIMPALLLIGGLFFFQQVYGANQRSQNSGYFVFLPVVGKPATDLQVTKLIVTQAIQRDNNSVPVIANKQTVVRVFAVAIGGDSQNNVVVSLSGKRNGSSLGELTSLPTTIPNSASRDDINSTFNFLLPANWLSGNVELTAKVDATNVQPEGNESNNTYPMPVVFNNVPTLQVKIVPINYTHQGPTNPGYYAGQAVDHISDWMERAFPVGNIEVTYRAPYGYAGNLETNSGHWGNFLEETYLLKLADGVPDYPVFYHALVPILSGDTRWFYGGIAGIGYIGYREAVSLNLGSGDDSGILSGHEVGHNMGRRHAPCGSVANPDVNYPYPGAQIGQYGLDIGAGKLWKPAEAVDFMSYCSPEWVSDYSYVGMYQDQTSNGRPLPRPMIDTLVIRVAFDDQMQAMLAPIYTFATVSSLPDTNSGYVIELLAADGTVLHRHPVALRYFEEESIQGHSIAATVPLPTTPVATIRLVYEGKPVAERVLTAAEANRTTAVTLEQTETAVTLNWNRPDTPAIIRYTNDNGQSYTTFGIDVTGGQLTIEKQYLENQTGYFELILADTAAAGTARVMLNE